MMLADSHTHFELLQDEGQVDQTAAIIERAQQEGIGYFLNVCVKLSRFNEVLRPAELYPFVYASAGLHPNDDSEEADLQQLMVAGNHDRVVAIGETGLARSRAQRGVIISALPVTSIGSVIDFDCIFSQQGR